MYMNSALKAYNLFLINTINHNKYSLLLFSSLTVIGYLSLPYLETYQTKIKKKTMDFKKQ